MKLFKTLFITIMLLGLSINHIEAKSDDNSIIDIQIIPLKNGESIEIITREEHVINTRAASNTKAGSRTYTAKDSSGNNLWYLKVHGTFTYNGTSSTCTASSVTAGSNTSLWKLSNKNTSRYGSTANAAVTAKRYKGSQVIETINRSISLSCSKTGQFI